MSILFFLALGETGFLVIERLGKGGAVMVMISGCVAMRQFAGVSYTGGFGEVNHHLQR